MVRKEDLTVEYFSLWTRTRDSGLMLFWDRLTKEKIDDIIKASKPEYRQNYIVTRSKTEVVYDFAERTI